MDSDDSSDDDHFYEVAESAPISVANEPLTIEVDNQVDIKLSHVYVDTHHASVESVKQDLQTHEYTERFQRVFSIVKEQSLSKPGKVKLPVQSFRRTSSGDYALDLPQSPTYVKVASVGSQSETLFRGSCRLLQELTGVHIGAVWAMKFSKDGRFLCTGGQDARVIIWSVGPSPAAAHGIRRHQQHSQLSPYSEDEVSDRTFGDRRPSDAPIRQSDMRQSDLRQSDLRQSELRQSDRQSDFRQSDLRQTEAFLPHAHVGYEHHNTTSSSCIIICPDAYRVFEGHTADITDVAWSPTHFLLSASVDKTVRLWHVAKSEKLQVIRHEDIVTSVDFHPTNEQYFVTGCFDKKLRLWDIMEFNEHKHSEPKYWQQLPEVVSVSITIVTTK
jgi:hypothetical protein